MRVLVVGSGGREHALVEALAQSPQAEEIFAAPGNAGMAGLAELVDIPADDLIALRNFARVASIDLTVVGPESPLVGGIAEAFWEAGLKIFGPSRAAARIEGSKVFAKEVMRHAGVPTARSEAFDLERAALDYLRSLPQVMATRSWSRWTAWRRARASRSCTPTRRPRTQYTPLLPGCLGRRGSGCS